jgi:hypothetical protein
VEAKSSSPRPDNASDFDAFIAEVRDKLTNALSFGLAVRLGRHAGAALPAPFGELDLASCLFTLVLVIRGHEDGWLPPVQEALDRALRPTVRTWALGAAAVAVLNDRAAREVGLVV